ncbi:hypothetical protein B0T16DRAFT_411269, partial [Cercophora newfieldiana]
MPYKDWVPGQSYEEHPPTCMRYIMEWKLTLNKRAAAKQTEENLRHPRHLVKESAMPSYVL